MVFVVRCQGWHLCKFWLKILDSWLRLELDCCNFGMDWLRFFELLWPTLQFSRLELDLILAFDFQEKTRLLCVFSKIFFRVNGISIWYYDNLIWLGRKLQGSIYSYVLKKWRNVIVWSCDAVVAFVVLMVIVIFLNVFLIESFPPFILV